MTPKRIRYNEFCEIVIDILENERNGINTRQINYLFRKKTGKQYYTSETRPKLHRMRKDGLIQATYSVKGYRWWNNKDYIDLKPNEVIVND